MSKTPKTLQEELKDRGYYAIKDPMAESPETTNDIAICKMKDGKIDYPHDEIVSYIKYVEVLQRNTAEEKMEFMLSKLPNENIQ